MLGEKIRKFLLRGGLKKKQDNQKKEKNGEHVYSNRMTVVAPITLALALPEMSPAEISTEIPAIPRPAVLRDQIIRTSRVSSHSLATYGHEDLIPIDGIPRPAFPRSFSAGMLHEERSQINRHIRYETLDKRGLKLSTVVVGPKRSAALAEWEGLEEGAEREVKSHLPIPPMTAEGGGEEDEEVMEGEPGASSVILQSPFRPSPPRKRALGYGGGSTRRSALSSDRTGPPLQGVSGSGCEMGLTRRSTPLAHACMAETDQGQKGQCTHARGTLFLSLAPLPQGPYHAKSIETSLELLGTIFPTVLRPSRRNTRHTSSGWTLRGPSIEA
ncbi:hypothetical protein TWF594_010244 [Orbilia oligospora]|uniref:Uncharacterized protein n=1 Tax=Orbilia oligospora TaxID=2813651 RepID=A0A7C8NT81_ORBOL|nr:hypothetical protein TWF594_010244 [Orbilia oligospora]KAF3140664.1 hypothetical protein TWF703_002870 [Orbilia oligospora]